MLVRIVALATVLCASPLRASSITSADSQTITVLYQKALQVKSNITQVGNAIAENTKSQATTANFATIVDAEETLSCLLRLQSVAEQVSGELRSLMVATSLTSLAQTKFDVDSGVGYSRLMADETKAVLAIAKRAASRAPAECPRSGAVAVRAEELRKFISMASESVGRLSSRIGPAQ